MKPETNAKLREACADLAKEITPHLSGFAPYTPVTVSSKTEPLKHPGRVDISDLVLSELRDRIPPELWLDRLGQTDQPSMSATEALWRQEQAGREYVRLANEPVEKLLRREIEIIRDLSDDGFNPYGSGPEPIGRRV